MEQGQFAYRKNLEAARKALLDQGSTEFKSDTASDSLAKTEQGLMRPKKRPESISGGMASGMGKALMESFAEDEKEQEAVEEQSAIPKDYPRPPHKAGTFTSKDLDERTLLAITLQAEAGGEGLDGMLAAGSVIQNRVRSGKYGKGLRGVIMKPGQFSAWNSETGYAKGEGGLDMGSMSVPEAALKAADLLLAGDYKDKTGGATHYYNDAVATPVWGAKAGGTWKRIGNHLFGFGDA
jgi:spore germination cell wall hydrolase CwlJ-like protein|tara:strand:+ start:2138 stop:2848 length:711 start_codon:yes stop_codon:yes gene_type:complete